MNPSNLLFVFGAILALIAIIGGGFEVRELKIPRVERTPRILSGALAVVFMILGIGISEPGYHESRDQGPIAPAPSSTPLVSFRVHSSLGDEQFSEQATILIDGKLAGNLTLSRQYPAAMISVSVPAPGKYSYTIDLRTVFARDGQLIEQAGAGQGFIEVAAGKDFELQYAPSGDSMIVVMAE